MKIQGLCGQYHVNQIRALRNKWFIRPVDFYGSNQPYAGPYDSENEAIEAAKQDNFYVRLIMERMDAEKNKLSDSG
jgi:hypothetical protein